MACLKPRPSNQVGVPLNAKPLLLALMLRWCLKHIGIVKSLNAIVAHACLAEARLGKSDNTNKQSAYLPSW
jgi:hypothetical protein